MEHFDTQCWFYKLCKKQVITIVCPWD